MTVLAGNSINLLSVNPGLVIWTAVTFLIVLIVLWKFAWKPITTALDERNQKVVDDLDESKKLRENAEKLLNDYEAKLESAKQEAMQLLEESRKDSESNKARILKEASDEAEKIKERTAHDIEQAKVKAIAEIEGKVLDLTVKVLSKVMKTQLTGNEHKDMISRELNSLH